MRKARLKALLIELLMDRGYSETEATHLINLVAMPELKEPYYTEYDDKHPNIGGTP